MTNEKRVVLIKPGDVLLIGGVHATNGEQLADVMSALREATGLTAVALFADDIQIDALTADQLAELTRRRNP